MAFVSDRIPFEEAISDPLLLKKRFDALSGPQQVALKAYYGVPLRSERELDIWSMFQGGAEFDELGRPTRITRVPYVPKEYDQAFLIWGRRSGKTDAFSSFVVVYEALLGGHHEHVGTHQEPVIFFVAQKVEIARSHLNFVRAVLATNPILQKEVASDTADAIVFKNRIRIEPAAPTIRSTRGLAIPVVVMDEIGFWYTDPDASNPDVEVERALSAAQAQFPHFKRFATSTPWTKEGLLWRAQQAGTAGWKIACEACASQPRNCTHREEDREEFKDVLVLHSPTAGIENPRINEKWLRKERARDADAFLRECLAEFVDSISGFLSMPLLQGAVDGGITERRPFNEQLDGPKGRPFYIAAMDPAFRRDRFVFTIVHHDPERGMVQDLLRVWTPGAHEDRVNPQAVLAEIKPILDAYDIKHVYSDQYQLESLQQLALGYGFTIEGVDFTGRSKQKIFGSLQQLLNQKRLRLLDKPELIQELASLERRYLPNGGVQISAPRGRHDDQASALAIALFKAVWLLPLAKQHNDHREPTLFEQGQATIARKRAMSSMSWGWDDF